jgi:hypothetical protein
MDTASPGSTESESLPLNVTSTALARDARRVHTGGRVDELVAQKLARNEALFREVNDQIHGVHEDWGKSESRYICECADPQCFDTIALSNDAYRNLREDPQRFVLVPGHEIPELERVVERFQSYLVVEKLVPVPRAAG